MFAPKVAKPRTKATASATDSLARPSSTIIAQRTAREAEAFGNDGQKADPTRAAAPGANSGVSWDFGKVPLFAPDRASRSQAVSEIGAPSVPNTLQRKLIVGEASDPLEHEADHVADRLMRMPAPGAGTSAAPQPVSGALQTRAGPSAAAREAPASVREALSAPGRPLDPESRAFFEPRFGFNFGDVRVHADGQAAESAREVDAQAYTVGNRIVFGSGRYELHSSAGRRLIAHELAHVVQQAHSPRAAATVMRQPSGGAVGSTASGGKPPFQPPGQTPFNFISESPALENWLAVMTEVLEREFKMSLGSAAAADEKYQAYLVSLPDDAAREDFGDRMRDRVRKGFYRREAKNPSYDYTKEQLDRLKKGSSPDPDTQLEHMEDVKTKVRGGKSIQGRPERALDPDNIYFTEGGPGGTAPKGTKHAEKYRTIDSAMKSSRDIQDEEQRTTVTDPQLATPPKAPARQAQGEIQISPPKTSPPASVKNEPKVVVDPSLEQANHNPPTVAKPVTAIDVEQPGGVVGGAAAPVPQTNRPSGVQGPVTAPDTEGHMASSPGPGAAIGMSTTITTLGLGWLAGYLKAKVDRKIAQRQVDALLHEARTRIDANPDEALKKMMINPEGRVYAWVHLDSAVITTWGVDNMSPEPTPSESSPMLDLGPIEYMTMPVDQSVVDSFPRISGGGRHSITVRTIFIDITLITPPLEDLISYAKSRQLPLDDLYKYVSGRFQGALSSSMSASEADARILNDLQSTEDLLETLQAQLKIAQKHKDVDLQKNIAERMRLISESSASIRVELKNVDALIPKINDNVKYWQYIMNLVKPAGLRP